jgi:hypothetical protein
MACTRRVLLPAAAVLAFAAHGLAQPAPSAQSAQPTPASRASDAIDHVNRNDLGQGVVDASSYVDQILVAHAVQGIPALEAYFARAKDDETEAMIASALVRLGDKDDAYWDFLVKQATAALESDAPYPYNLSGGTLESPFSPEFLAWAKARNLPPGGEAIEAAEDEVGKLAPLAQTGDPRGVPLLRRGLQSHNFFVQGLAAAGLAQAQDKDSIPLIIDACKRLPAALALLMAQALKYFDDPEAQAAFRLYEPGTDADIEQAIKSRGRPFGPQPEPQ